MPLAVDVLAATYSARDDVLWVLDQIRVGTARYARLLAVHPETGWATEAARWRRLTNHNGFMLAATTDGALYLAGGAGGIFVVGLLEPGIDAVQLRGVRLGVGTLNDRAGLSVDEDGVSLVVQRLLQYATVDYSAESFDRGGWGSCF